jgi:hypothetical protein
MSEEWMPLYRQYNLNFIKIYTKMYWSYLTYLRSLIRDSSRHVDLQFLSLFCDIGLMFSWHVPLITNIDTYNCQILRIKFLVIINYTGILIISIHRKNNFQSKFQHFPFPKIFKFFLEYFLVSYHIIASICANRVWCYIYACDVHGKMYICVPWTIDFAPRKFCRPQIARNLKCIFPV